MSSTSNFKEGDKITALYHNGEHYPGTIQKIIFKKGQAPKFHVKNPTERRPLTRISWTASSMVSISVIRSSS